MKAREILCEFAYGKEGGGGCKPEAACAHNEECDRALLALKEMVLNLKYNKCKCGECDMCGFDLAIDTVARLFEEGE